MVYQPMSPYSNAKIRLSIFYPGQKYWTDCCHLLCHNSAWPLSDIGALHTSFMSRENCYASVLPKIGLANSRIQFWPLIHHITRVEDRIRLNIDYCANGRMYDDYPIHILWSPWELISHFMCLMGCDVPLSVFSKSFPQAHLRNQIMFLSMKWWEWIDSKFLLCLLAHMLCVETSSCCSIHNLWWMKINGIVFKLN